MINCYFRGVDPATGLMVYGDLIRCGDGYAIATYEKITRVLPETVGQYTGVEDSKRNKIYAGDIVRIKEKDQSKSGWIEFIDIIIFEEGCFKLKKHKDCLRIITSGYFTCEVIGSTH